MPERLELMPAQLVESMNDWHFAMLNDSGRNEFFRGEIAAAIASFATPPAPTHTPAAGGESRGAVRVLDLGADKKTPLRVLDLGAGAASCGTIGKVFGPVCPGYGFAS